MKNILILSLLISFTSAANALGSGAQFLKIDTDARAVSMGAAYTALSSGVDSLAYNPAGLSTVKGVELGFSHTNWLMDSMHDFIGVALSVKGKPLAIGLGLTRLSNGSMDARNADRSAGGSFNSYDQAVTVGLADIIGKIRLGLNVKYIESAIAGTKARAGAVDIGFNRTMNNLPVGIGLSVQNLGTKMKYISQKDPLPLTVAAGLMFSVIPGVNLALDVKRQVYDKQTGVSFGTEYALLSGVALRAGYLTSNRAASMNNTGFSAGAGLNFWNTQLDYAVTPYGDLGNTQKITLKKKF
ncbi:MAG: PorV/PorQ family protein [Elusimicrobia bacterium]|nr:PorV/PorQ family protein [Elusimicrobiota bacterium]